MAFGFFFLLLRVGRSGKGGLFSATETFSSASIVFGVIFVTINIREEGRQYKVPFPNYLSATTMPSQIDITDIRSILKNVKSGRIKEAIDTAKRCAVALGLWFELDKLSSHERVYQAITEYMANETDSKQRSRELANIKEDLLRLSDIIRLEMQLRNPAPGRENDLYASAVRTRRIADEVSLSKYFDQLLKAGPQERFDIIDRMFTQVATTQHLSRDDEAAAKAFLNDPSADFEARAMLISALSLGNLYYYDRAKLMLLLSLPDYEPVELQARRLTGIYLALWRHPSRIGMDVAVGERIGLLMADEAMLRAMRKVAAAFLASRDTQRINNKMQQEIIPELQKLQKDLTGRFSSVADMAELFDAEGNPEWESMISNSNLGESLKEVSEMQEQGGDVMMLAFSNLKNFPFFHRPGNWLLPFNISHPALRKSMELNSEMLTLLRDSADFLCDPDKYSLGLALERVPAGQGDMMINQLRQQFEQYREDKATSFHKETEPKINVEITLYVRSLSRLSALFPHRGLRLPDAFSKAIIPAELPFLKDVMSTEDDLQTAAEFLFARNYYQEALPVLQRLMEISEPTPLLMEKMGFALQHTGDAEGALEYYRRAEALNDKPGIWLIRKLAMLNRALGHHDEAVRYWQMLDAMKPDDVKTTMHLANALLDAGKTQEALKKYYKADYLSGGYAKTWRPIAWCEFLEGHYDKAQLYYNKLLAMVADASDLLNAGHVAIAQGRMQEAIDLYTRSAISHRDGLEGFLQMLEDDREILAKFGLNDEWRALLADRLRFMPESLFDNKNKLPF